MSSGVLDRPRTSTGTWQPTILRKHHVSNDTVLLLRSYRITTFGILIVFLALQFLIPARLVVSGMGAAGRPSVAVGILLVFLWALAALRPKGLPAGRQPIRWLVGIYVAVQLATYAVGFDRGPTQIEANSADRWLIFTFAMAGVALAVCDGLVTRRQLDLLLRAMVGFAAVMAIVGILQYARIVNLVLYIRIPGLTANSQLLIQGARGDGDFARVAGTATHYIEFGVVLAIMLPLALHYALFSKRARWARVLSWVQVGLIVSAIPMSISRSAMLTTAVVLLLMLFVWKWRLRYNVIVIGSIALVTFHLVNRGLLGTIWALFTNVNNDPSIQHRLSDTATVVQLFESRPVLGRGAGMIIPEQYLLLDNQFYVTLLASGVVGVATLAALYLVPYFLARSIRLRTPCEADRHLAQALAVTFPAAMLAAGTFDAFSFATYVGVFFVLIGSVGALWRFTRGSVPKGAPQPLYWSPDDRFVCAPLMALDHPRWSSPFLRTSAARTKSESEKQLTRV
ncbi:O-antigen ligase family protein [Nakamurella multipartita]|uniref:O-antigen ligase-related domain-containing protein n=1 Tax=Nakamurella multipartita (strain ATCC 700099 / DSM 44233 / CIP 104796 / JCM 9543 / NBRC 105858 / Y-104) TaxID=479431 RepID=C8XKU9_NAKMY|nr:O-antigen ligase family protein [Nakamurella multipartita]ACV80756.1 hypothetical protein Namu_4472 [Nakamurella multipartita DSM 44233]